MDLFLNFHAQYILVIRMREQGKDSKDSLNIPLQQYWAYNTSTTVYSSSQAIHLPLSSVTQWHFIES